MDGGRGERLNVFGARKTNTQRDREREIDREREREREAKRLDNRARGRPRISVAG